jgi:hypothetical protein
LDAIAMKVCTGRPFFICGEILGSIKAKRDMPQHDDVMMDQEQ